MTHNDLTTMRAMNSYFYIDNERPELAGLGYLTMRT